MQRIRLLVFNAALGVLDYRVPHGMAVVPGSVVVAPLGPRQIIGIVWEPDRLPGTEVADARLRPIIAVLPVPPLAAPLRGLIEWTADYYCTAPSSVARMALASTAALAGGRTMTEYRLAGVASGPEHARSSPPGGGGDPAGGEPVPAQAGRGGLRSAPHAPSPALRAVPPPGGEDKRRLFRLTPQRAAATAALADAQGTMRELAELAGVSEGVLRGMVNAGMLTPVTVDLDRAYARAHPDFAAPRLEPAQRAAAAIITAAVTASEYQPFLLDGVTGSGKTECYFEAIAQALRQDAQVLVLLPEIALTQNFLRRFAARFGVPPVLWHSSLKSAERRRAWRAIVSGEAQVVVGARSALFLPYAQLRLIVVDEAHEIAFKQDEGVRYNARDVAVIRARFENIPVVLASATPALESLHLAEVGVYRKLDLPDRFGGATMPAIGVIDLTVEPPLRGHWLSPRLIIAMRERIARGEQTLLFLNRRGYAPLTLCRHCGYRFQCPNCSAWLVEHRLSRRLACHHCGHEEPRPDACPECSTPDCLVACGPGVERIADEVAALMPEARVALATSDTLNSPERIGAFVAAAESGAIDIIIGTQLVTKGYHFPELTLVGVIDADLGLEGGDLRAGERTYQQIAQVSGRAGRAAKRGEVLIQTRHPRAAVIAALASGNRDAFYAAEAAGRRDAGAPPFGRWAAIIVSAPDESEARDAARAIGAVRPDLPDVMILGPAPAPMTLLRGRYRYRLLINARRSAHVQDVIRSWLGPLQFGSAVRVAVDIDPYSFV